MPPLMLLTLQKLDIKSLPQVNKHVEYYKVQSHMMATGKVFL